MKCSKIKELLDTDSTIFVIDKTVIVKQGTKSTNKTSDEKKRYRSCCCLFVDSLYSNHGSYLRISLSLIRLSES